jgi:hypothetical protein
MLIVFGPRGLFCTPKNGFVFATKKINKSLNDRKKKRGGEKKNYLL